MGTVGVGYELLFYIMGRIMFFSSWFDALSNVVKQPAYSLRGFHRRRSASGHYGMTAPVLRQLESLEDRLLLSADGFAYVAGAVPGEYGISEGAFDMALDSQGNTYAMVDFSGYFDFDPGPDLYQVVGPGGRKGIVKLDPEGNLIWAKALTTNENRDFTLHRTMTVGDDDNIYVFQGGRNSSVVKFDSDGTLLEEFEIVKGSEGGIAPRGMSVDSAGNIYLGGYFGGELVVGEGDNTVVYTSTSETGDGVVIKLD
ncbi:MAG: LEPR-XLL domain-containing protein, partial [Planctomycetaceae bacterium]|nr:LEPR-XLL domain-containing protein [Planctomycetaceae bacterium]